MTFNRLITIFAGLFIMLTSFNSYAANYEYIYTSNPFHTVNNTYPVGSGPESGINTNDFFQLKISSDVALENTQGYSTEGYLYHASFEFVIDGISHLTRFPGFKGDASVFTQISFDEFDSNGVPTSWNLFTQELDMNRDLPVRESLYFGSNNGENLFGKSIRTSEYFYEVTAESSGGQWQFINNVPVVTVPEAPINIMFFAGLGMIGFVARCKVKRTS